MKKILAITLSLLMGVCGMIGCAKVEPIPAPPVAEIVNRISEAVTIPQATVIDDAETILTMYDLDTAMIGEMAMLKAGNGTNADEIIVIKLTDTTHTETVRAALELRVSVLYELFADYTPADVPKIENAVIETASLYMMLAVCDDPDAAKESFKASFTQSKE